MRQFNDRCISRPVRDRRIEDPTNLWLIHPSARLLLPGFIAGGISANAVSIGGFFIGALAASAYFHWQYTPFAVAGLFLSIVWLIADGLDGMIARATGTTSPLGRALDGLCDHGVFVMIYLALAFSIGTAQGWALALVAGVAHALQSNMYEGERARFHRRVKGIATETRILGNSPIVRFYDRVAGLIDYFAIRFDHALRHHSYPMQFGQSYGSSALAPMRLMSLLSANVRVMVIFLACLAGDPTMFWWFEITTLTIVAIIGLVWHRIIEFRLSRSLADQTPMQQQSKLKDVKHNAEH